MAANAGPDIIEDGIVFYYDTGNTVKSYIGEPTTNYYNSFSVAMPNLSGGNVTTDLPDGTTGTAFRVNVNSNSNTSRCVLAHNLPQPIPQANTRYTISHWIRTVTAVPVAAGWEAEVGAGDGYARPSFESGFVGNYGSFTQPNTITSTWTRVSYTFYYTSTKTTPVVPFIYFGSPSGGSGDSIGASIDFYGFQIEVNSHATQYTPSSRSATQGLLDMTRVGTINLTDVSFDSNAQMVFDGTNDTIYSPSNSSNNIAGDITMELILNRTNGYNAAVMHKEVQYTLYIAGNGDITYADSSYWSYSAFGSYYSGITPGSYHHVVATKSGSLVTIYVNSNVVISKTFGSAITQTNNNLYIGSYAGSSNYFAGQIPISKVYSRALTASEVQTNYNALKTRFGI